MIAAPHNSAPLGNHTMQIASYRRTEVLKSFVKARKARPPKGPKGANGLKGNDSVKLSGKGKAAQMKLSAMKLTYSMLRLTTGSDGAGEKVTAGFEFDLTSIYADIGITDTDTMDGALDKMREFFSPENTAQRIFDFAVSQYPLHLDGAEDTEETRQAFADFIGDAIQEGFDEAAAILGVLPESVQAEINETHELVFAKLDAFVQNGYEQTEEEATSIQDFAKRVNAAMTIYS